VDRVSGSAVRKELNKVSRLAGTRGSAVVKALRYKPEGYGFEIDELNGFLKIT
jgi:hypothetical protein